MTGEIEISQVHASSA